MLNFRSFEPYVARLREFIRTPQVGAASQAIASGQAADSFEALARDLFALQYRHNAQYARICDHLKRTPNRMATWHDVPFVPTQTFKELELTSLPPELRCQVFHSSGTTEQRPSRHFHSSESLALYELSLLTWFRAHLEPNPLPPRVLFLTPPRETAPHSSLIHMFDNLKRELAAPDSIFLGSNDTQGGWQLDLAAIQSLLSQICACGQPVWLMGTAFNFVHLLDGLEYRKQRFHLPTGSRVLETGGYKGRSRSLPKEQLHQLIHQKLGVASDHIICEYGMSELSSQAYDWPTTATPSSSREFRFPPWARCRVISAETGREVDEGGVGLLQILDLANVFSVMAIQTEDLVRRRADAFQWIGRASDAESRGCSLMSTDS